MVIELSKSPYADLELYFGLVSYGGCWEGRFSLDDVKDPNSYNCSRYTHAMRTVQESLDPSIKYKREIQIGYFPLMESEEKAKEFEEYCKKNIPRSWPWIKLHDVAHGKLRFSRVIRFEGWDVSREKELIKMCRDFGYVPSRYDIENQRDVLKNANGEEEKKRKEGIIEELVYGMWKENLRFH